MVPLCLEHLRRAETGTPSWQPIDSSGELPPVLVKTEVRIVHVHDEGPGVVYYIGNPATQSVKIGTTTRLRDRFAAIRCRNPEAMLLATEPGHYELERARHAQFKHIQVKQRGHKEWFTKTAELMEHITEVRREHGDPMLR
jgi:hypothetical protein